MSVLAPQSQSRFSPNSKHWFTTSWCRKTVLGVRVQSSQLQPGIRLYRFPLWPTRTNQSTAQDTALSLFFVFPPSFSLLHSVFYYERSEKRTLRHFRNSVLLTCCFFRIQSAVCFWVLLFFIFFYRQESAAVSYTHLTLPTTRSV